MMCRQQSSVKRAACPLMKRAGSSLYLKLASYTFPQNFLNDFVEGYN